MENETKNTMNEEIMEEVTELTEVFDEMPAEISEDFGSGLGIKLGLAGLGAAALAVCFVQRDKINEAINNRRIKKLEKQGFVVEYPVDDFDFDDFDDFEVDVEEDGSGNIIEIKGEEE